MAIHFWDCSSSGNNADKAQELFDRYVEGPYGLRDASDYDELREEGFIADEAEYWKFVQIFDDGVIDNTELEKLTNEGYSQDFVGGLKRLAGYNGAEAAKNRISWLGDNAVEDKFSQDCHCHLKYGNPDMLDELSKLAGSNIDSVSRSAVEQLLELGSSINTTKILAGVGESIVPILLSIAYDVRNREKCELAVAALGAIGKSAVPELIQLLHTHRFFHAPESTAILIATINALKRIGPAAIEAAPILRDITSENALFSPYQGNMSIVFTAARNAYDNITK